MKQAFAYLRVSSIGQLDGDGFDRQAAAVKKYAKASGLNIAHVFQEEGVSGTTDGYDRPALSRLFAAVKEQPEIKTVLVERADRIGRDLLVSEVILQEFRALGVTVIAAEGGVNLTDDTSPEKVLIRQILGAVAHFDRSIVVSKLKAARDRKSAALGKRCEGAKPYGTLEGEADILTKIQSLRRKKKGQPRLSLADICQRLNDEGTKTRSGKSWTVGGLQGILSRQ